MKLQDFFYAIGAVSGSGTDGVLLTWSYFQEVCIVFIFDSILTLGSNCNVLFDYVGC